MKRRILISICLAITFAFPYAAYCANNDKKAEGLIRPSILISQDRLYRLSEISNQQLPSWRRLIVWVQQLEPEDRRPENSLSLALASLAIQKLQPNHSKALAKKAALNALYAIDSKIPQDINQLAELISNVALSLDWAYQGFSKEQREKTANWLFNQVYKLKDTHKGCFDSESACLLKATTLAALAIREINPKAKNLLEIALKDRYEKHFLPCLKAKGKGGGWFEGENAGAKAGYDLLIFAAAIKTALGQDIFTNNPWFKDRLGYLVFSLLPGSNKSGYFGPLLVCPGGDQILPFRLASDLTRLQMLLIAQIWPKNQMVGWARSLQLDSRRPGVEPGPLLAWEFLWLEPEAVLAPMTLAPLSWHAKGLGKSFSRSDWSDRATWLSFSSGPHFAFRQHLDALSLVLFHQTLIMPPGGGYDGPATKHAQNYAIRTIAQNSILINDPGEYSWYEMRANSKPKNTYTNDGGQRAFSKFDQKGNTTKNLPWKVNSYDNWLKNQEVYDFANLEAHEDMPRFTYIRGNATKAYQGSTNKAKRVVRHVFHLRGNGPQDAASQEVVLCVDDIVLNRKNVKTSFVTHFAQRPQIPGKVKPLGDGRYEGPMSALSVLSNRLNFMVIPITPEKGELKIFGGRKQAACWVSGKNYPPDENILIPGPWRAEFTPQSGQNLTRPQVFALLSANDEEAKIPQMSPIFSQDPKITGCIIHDPLWPRVIVVRLGEVDKKASLTYEYLSGKTRHLVAGLAPETNYTITATSNRITLKPGEGLKSSEAGTLAFQIVPETNTSQKEN